jgi:hypothetical protein
LVQLEKDGKTLVRNTIPLAVDPQALPYLRLKWLSGGEPLVLTGINARHQTLTTTAPVADTWSLTGHPAEIQNSAFSNRGTDKKLPVAAWEYQRAEHAPIKRFWLDLGGTPYGDNISVYSRATSAQPWRMIHRGIWFNTQVGSDWQHSDAVEVGANNDVHWRVELNHRVSTDIAPTLRFYQPPQILQWIANNSSPYTIAIDQQEKGNRLSSETILSQLLQGKTADWVHVDFELLNPEINIASTTPASFNWRVILFWAVLFAAVAVLIGLALRLYRQMV